MKLKHKLNIQSVLDKKFAVVNDSDSKQTTIMNLNETGLDIIKLLENETSIDNIVNYLLKEYEIDEKNARDYTLEFIDTLKEKGLI